MKTTCLKILGAALTSLLFSGAAFGQAAVPFIFTPGTPARAAEVNSNFQVHTGAINANSAGIGANFVGIGINSGDIAINTAEIAANQFLRVVIVQPVFGNALASGSALLDAMAGITGATSANPYAILVEPGEYDLGGASLFMQPFVTVRGFGGLTRIVSAVDAVATGTIVGADDSSLKALRVENAHVGAKAIGISYAGITSGGLGTVTVVVGGATNNVGIFLDAGSDLDLNHVSVFATGGGNNYGVHNKAGSKFTLLNSKILAASGSTANYGVFNDGDSTVTVLNSEISAFGPGNRGIVSLGAAPIGPVEIHRSSIRAPGGFSLDAPATYTVNVAVSMLEGPKTGAGTFNCVGAYHGGFGGLGPSC